MFHALPIRPEQDTNSDVLKPARRTAVAGSVAGGQPWRRILFSRNNWTVCESERNPNFAESSKR
jgi:hypothetical protein